MTTTVPSLAQQQQASGKSIFWALAAIVINTMLQPSFCGYVWSGSSFEGSFWPHRSSPVICFLDSVADIWIGVKRLRGRNESPNEYKPSNPTAVLAQLVIFIMGVLPQAIKLFSMSGIPLAQTLAAIFLFSTITSMVRTLFTENTQQDIHDLIDQIKASDHFGHVRGVCLLCWAMHGIGLYLVCHAVVDEIGIVAPIDLVNAVQWVCDLSFIAGFLYMLQHTIFVIIGMKPPIPRYPIVILIHFTGMCSLDDILVACSKSCKAHRDRDMVAFRLFLTGVVFSCCVAYLLQFCVLRLLNRRQKASFPQDQSVDLPLTSTHSTEDSATQQAQQSRSLHEIGAREESFTGRQFDPPPSYASQTSENTGQVADLPTRSADPLAHSSTAQASMSNTESAKALGPPRASPPQIYGEQTIAQETASQNDIHASITYEASPAQQESVSGNVDNAGDQQHTPAAEDEVSNIATSTDPSLEDESGGHPIKRIVANIAEKIVVGIGVFIILIFIYADLFPSSKDDPNVAAQDEAERGAAKSDEKDSNSTDDTEKSGWKARLWRFAVLINTPGRFIIRMAITLWWRLTLAYMGLIIYTVNWVEWKMRSQSKDTIMIAFVVGNFAMIVLYYLVLFDGDGTFSPSWTSILG